MRINKSFAALSIVSSLLVGTLAGAEDARLQGVFVNPTQSEVPIKSAIDEAAAPFHFLARPIARSRLKKTNPVVTRVTISRSGDDITIQLGASKPNTARPGGPAIKWSRDDETFDLTLAWEGNALNQLFVAPDGKRFNRFRFSPDGNTLSLEVTIVSEQLKKPMHYTLTFAREVEH